MWDSCVALGIRTLKKKALEGANPCYLSGSTFFTEGPRILCAGPFPACDRPVEEQNQRSPRGGTRRSER